MCRQTDSAVTQSWAQNICAKALPQQRTPHSSMSPQLRNHLSHNFLQPLAKCAARESAQHMRARRTTQLLSICLHLRQHAYSQGKGLEHAFTACCDLLQHVQTSALHTPDHMHGCPVTATCRKRIEPEYACRTDLAPQQVIFSFPSWLLFAWPVSGKTDHAHFLGFIIHRLPTKNFRWARTVSCAMAAAMATGSGRHR